MRPAFWAGKRVFVTGHTGFKGGWLALWLQSAGATVRGYALPPAAEPNLFTVARVGDGMDSLDGDIRDRDRVDREVAAFRPDIVLHLAAQALVRASYEDPVGTYATNVLGTVHVLEAARRAGSVRAIVNVTSDKCYENREQVWGYRETDPMGGYDPYSSSKGCAELVAAAYGRSYFNPGRFAEHRTALASARAGNVIGGGDWAQDRLVPDIVRAFLGQGSVGIRNPRAVRPWQHVLEPVGGYLLLAERLFEQGPALAGGWNFGPRPEDARTVAEVVDVIRAAWGGATAIRDESDLGAPHEAGLLTLDIAKARHHLGWSPRWCLEDAIAATIAWYQAADRGDDMHDLTLAQIASYSGRGLGQAVSPPTEETVS